jgi:glycosyltransferase involved in cell wall biosynthesis
MYVDKQKKIKISVAIATFNGAKYLAEQLKSIACQTVLPDEVIICDDNSTDSTLDIIKCFQRVSPFAIKLFKNNKALGCKGNFERALARTTGDLVFLSDQDDYWYPEKIDTVARFMGKHCQCLLVMNDCDLTDSDLKFLGHTKLESLKLFNFDQRHFVMGCTMAIHRRLVNKALPFPKGDITHDQWIALLAMALDSKVILPVALQKYRRHGDNVSKAVFNQLNQGSQLVNLLAKWAGRMRTMTSSDSRDFDFYLSSAICRLDCMLKSELTDHEFQKLSLLKQLYVFRKTTRQLNIIYRLKLLCQSKNIDVYHKFFSRSHWLRDLLRV